MINHYRIKVTTKDGMFWYSAVRGLVDFYDQQHFATRFDSREGVEVAVKLLQKRYSDWFVQWKFLD